MRVAQRVASLLQRETSDCYRFAGIEALAKVKCADLLKRVSHVRCASADSRVVWHGDARV